MEALPESVSVAIVQLREVADQEQLSRAARLRMLAVMRTEILPKRKPGRKNSELIDRAYADYKAGMRGLKLYRKHIPSFRKLSRWRRRGESDRLLKNLQKRSQREKLQRQKETNPSAQLSPRQLTPGNCQPDISV